MKRTNVVFILSFFIFSCQATKNIPGTYRSNFADLGFFVTRIELKIDSTFEYRFRGDLINDSATGKFRIDNRKLFLVYDPRPIDTSGLAELKRRFGLKVDYRELKSDAGLPHIYYIRGHRLFNTRADNGEIVKRAVKYNKRKKYIFFGSHYYPRKWYLEKIE